MKPVESYRGISPLQDHSSAAKAASPKAEAAKVGQSESAEKAEQQNPAVATTAARLAGQKPPFDVAKVEAVKAQIAAGNFAVDTDSLAKKMLEVGVFGVESKK